MGIKHKSTATRADGPNDGRVQSSWWNDDHEIGAFLSAIIDLAITPGTAVFTKADGTMGQFPISDFARSVLASIDAATLLNAIGGAPVSNAVLGGTPTLATSPDPTDSTLRIATMAAVQGAVARIVNSAPTTLDTLKELADALGDDPNFATTTATSLGNRLRFDAAQTLTTGQKAQAIANLALAAVAASGAYSDLTGKPVIGTAANNLVQLDGSAKLPAVDGSQLTNLGAVLDFRNVAFGNGGFDIWQRGAGGAAAISVAASSTAYTADRWFLQTQANQASVVTQIAGITARSRYSAAVQRVPGQTGTGVMAYSYPLTTEEVIRLRGQRISLQAALQATANWSPVSGALGVAVFFGTGAQGKRGLGSFTSETVAINTSINLPAGGAVQNLVVTSAGTVPANATQGEIQFYWTPVGTAGAADEFIIDDVQLEAGTAATAFERVPAIVSLVDCLKFYRKTFPYTTAPAQNAGTLGAFYAVASGTSLGVNWYLGAPMHASPTMGLYSPNAASPNWSTNGVSPTSSSTPSDTVITILGAGATDQNGYFIHATADSGL